MGLRRPGSLSTITYRPGMASDEDYFVPDPISDIDIYLFDVVMDVVDVEVIEGGVGEMDKYGYLPLVQKMTSDV